MHLAYASVLPEMVSCWMCLMARAAKLAVAGPAAPSRPYSAVHAKRDAAKTVLLFCKASHSKRACMIITQALSSKGDGV